MDPTMLRQRNSNISVLVNAVRVHNDPMLMMMVEGITDEYQVIPDHFHDEKKVQTYFSKGW